MPKAYAHFDHTHVIRGPFETGLGSHRELLNLSSRFCGSGDADIPLNLGGQKVKLPGREEMMWSANAICSTTSASMPAPIFNAARHATPVTAGKTIS